MQKTKQGCYFYFIPLLFFFVSCRSKPSVAISFYYWKTNFELNQYENNTLAQNNVQSLYVRYFDVILDPASNVPRPVSTITFDSAFTQKQIIPVVYIKNRVFEKTKDNFFLFLNQYKKLSHQKLSATIRLHQVKYSHRTGIPPVDQGVLMFYNIGTITAGDANSIYEKKNALKYVASLKHYPLRLDIALPLFSWGIGTRHGKVHYLLNKMYAKDFERDSNFIRIATNRFKAKHSFFKSGYYIMANDEIKIENIKAKDLNRMAVMLKKNISNPVTKIIFYDLDSNNFINYESNIFQTISQKLR